MRSQLRTSVLVAGLFVSAPLALADITVGPEGSGAQTDSLNDAIFNADEGETIFVFAGTYPAIRVVGKSVRIVGEGPDLVTFTFDDPDIFGPGNRVEGLAPGQSAFFSGVTFDQKALGSLNAPLTLVGNRGRLFFHDCVIQSTGTASAAAATIFSCEDVSFDRCTFTGFQPEPKLDPITVTGGDGILVESSNLRLNNCSIEAGDALQPGLFFSTGGIGIEAADTTLVLHNTSISGGDAQESNVSGSGTGAGIFAETSDVTISGGSGTQIVGGDGNTGNPLLAVPGAPGVQFVFGGSTLTLSEAVTVQGGTGSDGLVAIGLDLFGAAATVELFARPGIAPSVATASPGDSFSMNYDGEPGATQVLALAFDTVLPYGFAEVSGDAILDPLGVDLVGLVGLDANGAASQTFVLPPEPALTGTCGFFQSLQSGGAGGSRLSLPTAFLVAQ